MVSVWSWRSFRIVWIDAILSWRQMASPMTFLRREMEILLGLFFFPLGGKELTGPIRRMEELTSDLQPLRYIV